MLILKNNFYIVSFYFHCPILAVYFKYTNIITSKIIFILSHFSMHSKHFIFFILFLCFFSLSNCDKLFPTKGVSKIIISLNYLVQSNMQILLLLWSNSRQMYFQRFLPIISSWNYRTYYYMCKFCFSNSLWNRRRNNILCVFIRNSAFWTKWRFSYI